VYRVEANVAYATLICTFYFYYYYRSQRPRIELTPAYRSLTSLVANISVLLIVKTLVPETMEGEGVRRARRRGNPSTRGGFREGAWPPPQKIFKFLKFKMATFGVY